MRISIKQIWIIFNTLFLLALMTSYVSAASLGFSWLPNTETDLAGYKIHYGDAARTYVETRDCGLPETTEGRVHYTLENVPDGTIFYAATAYDANNNESEYSDEVSADPQPNKVQDVRIDFIINVNINTN